MISDVFSNLGMSRRNLIDSMSQPHAPFSPLFSLSLSLSLSLAAAQYVVVCTGKWDLVLGPDDIGKLKKY
jgi:hypothetical protein